MTINLLEHKFQPDADGIAPESGTVHILEGTHPVTSSGHSPGASQIPPIPHIT